MEIKSLRAYVTFSQYLNYTQAAQAMYMSQPTLSKLISSLERDLDIELIDHKSKPLQLTYAGKELLKGAHEILSAHDETLRRMSQLTNAQLHQLRIGAYIHYRPVAELLSFASEILMKGEHPFDITMRQSGHWTWLDYLNTGKIDVTFTTYPNAMDLASEGIAAHLVFLDPLVLIVNQKHMFAELEKIKPADLAGQRVLVPSYSNSLLFTGRIKEIFLEKGVDLVTQKIEMQEVTGFYTLDTVHDVALVPAGMINSFSSQNLTDYKIMRFSDELLLDMYALYRIDNDNLALTAFIDCLNQERSRISKLPCEGVENS